MRLYRINYDIGFSSGGTTTHEPFDSEIVRREMQIIREDLHCDGVRITGADPDRLETAARHAAEAGLEVRYSPFTNGLTPDELMALLVDSAERAERLHREGASVVFLTGSEISLLNAQQLVETGPYRLVRHPGYAGSLLTWAGFALAWRSLPVVVLVTGLLARAYRDRIRAEEELLRRVLPGYADYARRTWRLVPYVW